MITTILIYYINVDGLNNDSVDKKIEKYKIDYKIDSTPDINIIQQFIPVNNQDTATEVITF